MRAIFCLSMLWLPVLGLAEVDDNASVAQELLMQRLQSDYPQVTRWKIEPLAEKGWGSVQSIASAEVIKTGVRSAVRVVMRDDQQRTHRFVAWYAVSGFAVVPTAARKLTVGAALNPNDTKLMDADLVAAGCEPLSRQWDAPDAVALRIRRTTNAGGVVCSSAVERRPAVSREQEVSVRYMTAGMQLTARAIAQTDGEPGMRIPVKSLGTREVFTAVVESAGEVVVHE